MSRTIRLLEERQLATEVTIMQWSPKMDLLAVANKKGEVALHRLSWQRVWLIAPPEDCETVSDLFWRPDGKLLAVFYSNSKSLHLIDIENKNIIHKKEQESKKDITCMAWLPISSQDVAEKLNFNRDHMLTSPTGPYLPPLPNLNRSFNHELDRKEFLFHSLDILFLGHNDGEITMYVFGMFYCGTINIGPGVVTKISGGLGKSIWVTCQTDAGIIVQGLSCPLLENCRAFLKIAQMQANINYLMDYLSQTLMAISEAWETILLEMDEKLSRYEEDELPGTLAADFLELLMIGISSNKLANFLLHDLSDKGLKKLGHSIEICYSNIQKLVLKHLNSVSMALIYQLAEMQGMARFGRDYEDLGLTEEVQITDAKHAAETFLAKSSEIQQVIDHSMKEYKAFFRWLYVEIAKLTDEKIPSEASKISQQELTFIAEFLLGFDTSAILPASASTPTSSHSTRMDRRKGVNLEKLGQYLRREKLKIPLSVEGSDWATLLEENKRLHNHPLTIKQNLDLSLLQSHEKLVIAIDNLFAGIYKGLVDHFSITTVEINLKAQSQETEKLLSTQIVNNDNNLIIAVVSDNNRKALRLFKVISCDENKNLLYKSSTITLDNKLGSFSKQPIDLTIIDLQFYSTDYLSLLVLNHNNFTMSLIQLLIDEKCFNNELFDNSKSEHLCSDIDNTNYLNISDFIGNNLPKSLGSGVKNARIFVSGPRKVAAILSDNNRKVRLLETEVELDDDDDDDDEDDDDENGDNDDNNRGGGDDGDNDDEDEDDDDDDDDGNDDDDDDDDDVDEDSNDNKGKTDEKSKNFGTIQNQQSSMEISSNAV